jgi:orotate phosphoribosyltransferase
MIMETSIAKQLVEYLLQIKAIRLNVQNPFQWASGWKSPVYCDNRKLLSYPEVRNFVKIHLTELVKTHFPEGNCVAGVATAGIPHGALVADVLGLPFVYVRDKPKGHGMQNVIEGVLPENARVIVIEDVISTGSSSLKAVDGLRAAGAEIEGMGAIYTYNFDVAQQAFEAKNVILKTLTNYDILIKVAEEKGEIAVQDLETLNDWRKNPADWNSK